VERIEMELQLKLLPTGSVYHVALDLAQLQRGSISDQIQWAVSLANIRAVTLNEVRGRFGLNPVDGGDDLIEPVNYSPNSDIQNGTKNRENEQSGNQSGNADN
jgi:hypothetical protein